MNVEEVDLELETAEAAETSVDTSAFSEAQLKMFNVCSVYAKARPVLKFARGLLFWRPRWQEILDAAMAALDESCNIQK